MIALANTTAILLNHPDGTVRFVEYDGKLDTLRQLLGVDLVDAMLLDTKHIMFYDDEMCDKPYRIGFEIHFRGITALIKGSALITGDDAGENAPLKIKNNELKINVIKL
jgi:hypothetical protein